MESQREQCYVLKLAVWVSFLYILERISAAHSLPSDMRKIEFYKYMQSDRPYLRFVSYHLICGIIMLWVIDLLACFCVSAELSKSEFLRRLCNGIYDNDQIPEPRNLLWCSLARFKPYEHYSGSGLNAGRMNFHSVGT